MKSRTYSHLGELIDECQPHLGKLGEALAIYAVSRGKQFLTEREQREKMKEVIREEYFQLTGKEPDYNLERYISDSVDKGWKLYQNYGEKGVYQYAISQLEKAKDDFTLESRVIEAVDDKIKELQNKL